MNDLERSYQLWTRQAGGPRLSLAAIEALAAGRPASNEELVILSESPADAALVRLAGELGPWAEALSADLSGVGASNVVPLRPGADRRMAFPAIALAASVAAVALTFALLQGPELPGVDVDQLVEPAVEQPLPDVIHRITLEDRILASSLEQKPGNGTLEEAREDDIFGNAFGIDT